MNAMSALRIHPRLAGWLAAAILPGAFLHAHDHPHAVPELETFVITGTRTDRLISEAPVKTELIMRSDLQAYNLTSFRDALKLIPSARFESDCQNCGVNQIQLLGLSTDYTAILFDGAPLYSGLAKVYGADLFPAIFVNRIEIVKGGSSVLYGPEAIAGVVNLITAEPIQSGLRSRAAVGRTRGGANEWEAALLGDHVDPAGKFSVSVYGYTTERDGIDLTGDGFSDIAEFRNHVAGAQSWWHPSSESTLKTTYQYLNQRHRGGDSPGLPEEQARIAESLHHEIHMLHFDWRHQLSRAFDYNLRASYLDIERISFYGARGDNEQRAYEDAGFSGDVTDAFIDNNQDLIDAVARNVWGRTRNHVYYLDTQFNHHVGDHTVSYGLQLRHEDLTDGSRFDPTVPVTKDNFSNIGVFIQDQWRVSDRLELVPGIRVDDHDKVDGRIYSPRVAARLRASDELTVRASWATGFNAPGAFNEDKHIGVNNGGAIFLVNSPNLKEESSQTWSFGVDFVPDAHHGRVILHSQLHFTRLRDSFVIDDSGDITGDGNFWLRYNGPDAHIFVWENSLNWRITDHLRLDAGLSYIRSRYREEIEQVTGLETKRFMKQPDWMAHLGLAYNNPDLFDAYAIMRHTGTMIAIGQESDIWRKTPEFFVVDLGLSRALGKVWNGSQVVAAIGVDNVFDDRQKDLQANGEERDPTYTYGPTRPRTFYLSLRLGW